MVTAKSVAVNAVYGAAGSGSVAIADTEGGFFLSSDRGRNWKSVQLPASRTELYNVAVGQDGVLLAATSRGLYRSVDEAVTWQLQTGPLGTATVRTVLFHPSQMRAFAVLRNEIYQSQDDGITWTQMPNMGLEECRVETLAVSAEAPGELYAATRGRGVYVLSLPDLDAHAEVIKK